jgi:hypothetical protein
MILLNFSFFGKKFYTENLLQKKISIFFFCQMAKVQHNKKSLGRHYTSNSCFPFLFFAFGNVGL